MNAPPSPPDAAGQRLLSEVDRALGDTPLVPLSEARFEATHVLYEGRSDQQGRIIDWFAAEVAPTVPEEGRFRVLSVGCGSGILDVPVARHLASHGAALTYVGVDPNAVECRTFLRRFAEAEDLAGVDVEVVSSSFEAFAPEERFDLVHLVHCLYYFPDAAAALDKACSLLAPGGRLVVFHAPRGRMNELAARFYDRLYDRPTLFAAEVEVFCRQTEWLVERARVDARVDVTPMAEGDDDVGLSLRDFIVQVDSRELSRAAQRAVDAYLQHIAVREPDGRVSIPHPVDVFDIVRPTRA